MSIHQGTGYWCRKVRGKVYYFGKVADDPKGVAALDRWLEVKDDLHAGREPRAKDPDAVTIADAVNEFLTHHEQRRDDGEISPRTFQALHATCANIVDAFGKGRAVTDLAPDDFGRLRKKLSKTRGAVALRNEQQRCRSVFRFAYVNGLINREVRYGSKFDKPPLKQVRRDRREQKQKHGARMFEATEVWQLLAEAGEPLRTMILLAINCGMGQTDLARLPVSSINLNFAMIDYPRPKTEAPRLCPLWAETVESIREWLPVRPKAKARADADLLFLTYRGNRFVKTGRNGTPIDGIGQEFGKVVRKLGLERPGRSFYALRHSFRTVADETLDPVAVGLIMGHVDSSMADAYRERISPARLRAVVDVVHSWLFADGPDDTSGPEKVSSEIYDPCDPCDPNPVILEENADFGRLQNPEAGRKPGRRQEVLRPAKSSENPTKIEVGVAGSQGSQKSGDSFRDNAKPLLRLYGG